jgi:DNA-binding NarL/FixJ family response regulator
MINDDDSLKGRHFVLLDEDRFTAQMIQTLMPTLGAVTMEICQGVDATIVALKAALTRKAVTGVIALVDLDGERRLGLTLLKAVRSGAAGLPRGLPVLALAGHSDQTLILKAHDLDVGAVLARPLSRSALHASCRRLGPTGIEPRSVEAYAGVEIPAA